MAATAAATKSYFIGPQDGWVEIVTGAVTPINFLRISGYPHTHPFQIAVSASAPARTVPGITICHCHFEMHDNAIAGGVSSVFWVKVNNPSNQTSTGQMRIDVYSEGGVLQ